MVTLIAAMLIQTESPTIESLLKEVDRTRMRVTVEKLAGFPTRNTISAGLADAANWVADSLRQMPRLQVELMRYRIEKSRRVPEDKDVVQVVATLPGADSQIVIVGAHLDSLNLSVDAATGRAPGANDDASGVAVTMELARIFSKYKWTHTMKFVAFTGEEQGLLGSRALAELAKSEGWKIDGVFSNDTVGSSSNKAGQKDTKRVRIFSDETETTNSRDLARFIEWTARKHVNDFGVKLVFRKDRFGRGGDHTPFSEAGFPAVRFIEVHEEYTRQHTGDDLPDHMDWEYLANVARINLAAMATLARSSPAPTNVRIDLRQGHDTTITWNPVPGTKYLVFWRETTDAVWRDAIDVGVVSRYTVKGVNKDDHLFAVAAVNGVPVPAR